VKRYRAGLSDLEILENRGKPNNTGEFICAKFTHGNAYSGDEPYLAMIDNYTLYFTMPSSMSVEDVAEYISSTPFVYELATPTTSQAEPFSALQLCDPSGTEEYVTDGIPVGHETEYAPEDGTLVRTLALTEMPLTATITGAGQGGTTMLAIERAQDYQMARPNGDTSDGFTGENVALFSQMGEDEITIDNGDLLGHLDDGAWYRIVATVQDGFGQSATAELEFMVHWSHQALVPEAEAEPIEAYNAMQITPIPPNGTQEGDTFDIYRLSADKPELVVEDGEWGTTYVDPYPAIREFGGHRVVFKTKNGDYITEDDTLAWIDLSRADDDYIDRDCTIIDFDGAELIARLNMSVSDDYEKQFTETRYKGGSVIGDWNKGISRKGAIKAVALADDPDTIRILRELARFEGVCHVRTPNGTSYAADVQVGLEQSYESVERAVSFDLTITRVDVQDLDGMTLDEWNAMHPESE
jgi:hypothetical protein